MHNLVVKGTMMVALVMLVMVALMKGMKADMYQASALHGDASIKKVSIDSTHPSHPTAVLKKKAFFDPAQIFVDKYLTEIMALSLSPPSYM